MTLSLSLTYSGEPSIQVNGECPAGTRVLQSGQDLACILQQ